MFFLVTVLIWFRSQFLLSAFHYDGADGFAPVVLAVAFGLVFAFWPTTSLTSITYSLVLAHLRALYLVVATVISVVSLTLAGAIAALIVALPTKLFAALAYAVVHFTGGHIDPTSTTQILVTIGGISVIIMTARSAWDLARYMYTTYAVGVHTAGIKCIGAWRRICQVAYTKVSRIPLRLGFLLGGDVS